MHAASDLVDLGPSIFNTGYVIQGRTVLPEWTTLDIEDESNGREIHVGIFVHFGRITLCGSGWRRRSRERAFIGNLG
jgi:hypothetical protein